ncbi:tetratricopeptide repeat-containing sensor histidine kinase [Marinigracilibium pacificum]|uniref:histidine kinase n=1 Tax=Marinigracilibium pacificum TaxID=2729599 RepID=A0A848IX16_9BACT|nr:tetratricopeptide repeat-containing sensor histidine kinase [Marinigracilibium pacificum]NMM48857.1 sensor histidine kinase [Marinigracilibium pacificum]
MAQVDQLYFEELNYDEKIEAIDSLNAFAWEIKASDISKSLEISKAVMNESILLDYVKGRASALQTLGYINYILGNYSQATELYLKGLRSFEEIQDVKGQIIITNAMGLLYFRMERYDLAGDYYKRAEKIASDVGLLEYISRIDNNKGMLYLAINKPEQALNSFRNSLDYMSKQENRQGVAYLYNNIAESYLKLENYDSAEYYFDLSLKIKRVINDNYGIAYTLLKSSDLYIGNRDTAKALQSIDEGIELSSKYSNGPLLLDFYMHKYQLQKATGKYEDALSVLEVHNSLRDSLNLKDEKLKVASLELTRQLEEKINELNLAKKVQANNRINTLLLAGVIILLFGLVILISLYYRGKVKANKELQELVKIKDELFTIISHDFRAPLKSLKGMLELMRMGGVSERELQFLTAEMLVRFDQTDEMLTNLLHWAKSSIDEQQLIPEFINVKDLLIESISSFDNLARQKQLDLKINVSSGLSILTDRNALSFILKNLFSNAMKFSKDNSVVRVNAFNKGNQIIFEVQDFGFGISSDQLNDLFRWKAAGKRSLAQGVGIGLMLCYDLAKKLKGELLVESHPEEGSTFILRIPHLNK